MEQAPERLPWVRLRSVARGRLDLRTRCIHHGMVWPPEHEAYTFRIPPVRDLVAWLPSPRIRLRQDRKVDWWNLHKQYNRRWPSHCRIVARCKCNRSGRESHKALQKLKGQHLHLPSYGGWGSRVSPVWARNASMRAGRYWMRLSRFFMIAASWSTSRTARLPRLAFMAAQAPSAGFSSGA